MKTRSLTQRIALLTQRITLLILLPFLALYCYFALSVCWVLLRPFGDSEPLDSIEESFGDVTRDIPRALRMLITGKDVR